MNRIRKRRQDGFSLLEFALVVLVSAAVSAVALNRFDHYREQAEIVSTRQVVGAIRTALQARSAQMASNGRRDELHALAQDNPMNLLAQKPDNYLGEYYAPDPKRVGRAGWVFDPRDKTLLYLPRNNESFTFGTAKLLKFKVEFLDTPGAASKGAAGENSLSLALNQVNGPGGR